MLDSQDPKTACEQAFDTRIRPFATKYALACHNPPNKSGGIAVDSLRKLESLAAHAGDWEHILRKGRTGEMPPEGMSRVKPATSDAFVH